MYQNLPYHIRLIDMLFLSLWTDRYTTEVILDIKISKKVIQEWFEVLKFKYFQVKCYLVTQGEK